MGERETTAKHHTWRSISIKYYSNVNALKRLLRSTSHTRNLAIFLPSKLSLNFKKIQSDWPENTSWGRSIFLVEKRGWFADMFPGEGRKWMFTSLHLARTTLKMHAGCVTRDEIRRSANFSKRATCSKFQDLRREMLRDGRCKRPLISRLPSQISFAS